MDDALAAARLAVADAAIATRAFVSAELHNHAVALQCRRLRSTEPEDRDGPTRWRIDLQFLLIELELLGQEVEVFGKTAHIDIGSAIRDYAAALSELRAMRAINADSSDGRQRVDAREFQAYDWDGTTYTWAGYKVNIDHMRAAAEKLFNAMRAAANKLS